MRFLARAGHILPMLLVTGLVAFGFTPASAQTAGTIGGGTIGQDQRTTQTDFSGDGSDRGRTIVAERPVLSAAPAVRVQRTRSLGGQSVDVNRKRAFQMPWQTGVYQ